MLTYGRLKTKENVKLLVIKVVMDMYKLWLLTRDSQCSDLTGKLLLFLENWSLTRGGCSREMVTTGSSTVV